MSVMRTNNAPTQASLDAYRNTLEELDARLVIRLGLPF